MRLHLVGEHPDRRRQSRVHLLAVILVVLGAYVLPIALTLSDRAAPPLKTVYLYYTGLAVVMIPAILLLQRYLCGQRVAELNLRPGVWWRDILLGAVLAAVTLGTTLLLQGPLLARFPPQDMAAMDAFFREFVSSPQLFLLMMGPVLVISAAVFEELTRVFVLNHLWQVNPSAVWRWLAILLSAALFGLAHLYQGPAGVINAALNGLLLAVAYALFGRVVPLIVAHYLYDAIQFGAVYLFANLP
jgi:hypothetical protein